jgi:rhodanese-related sulfurtransferase
MGLLDLFGLGDKSESIKDFINRGAIIIDVRTTGEFREGHIKNSKNIVLDTISSKINEIKELKKPIIVCCRSGMRSAQAAAILKNNGVEVLNGGGWESLQSKL